MVLRGVEYLRGAIPPRAAAAGGNTSPSVTPRTAAVVLVLSVVGFGLIAVDGLLAAAAPVSRVAGVSAIVALSLVQIVVASARTDRWGPRAAVVILTGQVVLLGVPVAVGQPPWPGVPGLVGGSALVLLPPWLGTAALGAIAVATAALVAAVDAPHVTVLQVGVTGVATLVVGLAVFGLTTMWRLSRDALEARPALDRAVAERERALIAQDVHDLLGSSLSAVVLRCELVSRLLPDHPEQAVDELQEAVRLSRRVRDQVRRATEGRPVVDLADECREAEQTLALAGVRTSVRRFEVLPRASLRGAVLAASLREGVTNVLRHSVATWCEIEVSCDAAWARLVVTNDGAGSADDAAHADGDAGRGLANLGRRASELGGSVLATSARGVHRLEVRVPEPPLSQPVRLAGDADGVQSVAGVELRDRGGQVVAHGPGREEQP